MTANTITAPSAIVSLAEPIYHLRGLWNLRDPDVFAQAQIAEHGHALEWPGDTDISADPLWDYAHNAIGRDDTVTSTIGGCGMSGHSMRPREYLSMRPSCGLESTAYLSSIDFGALGKNAAVLVWFEPITMSEKPRNAAERKFKSH